MLSTISLVSVLAVLATHATGAHAELPPLKDALSRLSSSVESETDKNFPSSDFTAAMLIKEVSVEGKCAIIFDFDGVIKIYQDAFDNDSSIGRNAQQVLSAARDKNLDIGLATMSCEKDFIIRYLNRNFEPSLFTDGWLSSEKAQFCEPKKSVQMAKIISTHGADWNCAILYDDSIGNKPDVEGAGHIYQFVDRYVGITMSEFDNGLSLLRARGNCNC